MFISNTFFIRKLPLHFNEAYLFINVFVSKLQRDETVSSLKLELMDSLPEWIVYSSLPK